MKGKSHFIVSMLKSLVRIVAVIGSIYLIVHTNTHTTEGVPTVILASGIGIAEVLGIVEELVDSRG